MSEDFNEDDLELVGSIKEKTALQRSHALCVSASQCYRIMSHPEQESLPPSARAYCEAIVAAQGKHYYKDVSTPAMQWGVDNEPKALELFSEIISYHIEHTGVDDSMRLYYRDLSSALPDGLIYDNSIIECTVEVKCLDTDNHIAMIDADIKKVDYEKHCQVQAQILCANTSKGILVFYDPRYEENTLHWQSFPIDQEWRNLFLKRAALARDYIKELQGESKAVTVYSMPNISIDTALVATYLDDPNVIVNMVRKQVGNQVFSMETAKSRDACAKLGNQVIKCITRINDASKALAADAKKVIEADRNFRKATENGIRAIAEEVRQPIKEWEAEQERIAKEKADAIAEQERIAREAIESEAREKQFLADWDMALLMDELETLRAEKADREAKERSEKEQAEREAHEETLNRLAVARENARIETERRQREANDAHVKAIDESVDDALIAITAECELSSVLMEDDKHLLAGAILQGIKDGKIPHVSINY